MIGGDGRTIFSSLALGFAISQSASDKTLAVPTFGALEL
jgi:hypothetical protein